MMLAWKDALLEEGLSPKSIKEVNIAAARSLFKWAVNNHKITRNPAEDITIDMPKNYKKTQGRAFTDLEAHLILSESLRPKSKRTTDHYAAAKRWVPWICAYTGARVNEITQLRFQDVVIRKVNDAAIWAIVITPEAGTTKNNQTREVPLHPHLVEQGFLDFVMARGEGALFYDSKLARTGSTANPQYAKVGNKTAEWVRDIGVNEPMVQPNHGWRHTFQRLAIIAGMEPEIRDAIKGHAPRTEGEKYGGDPPMDAKWREIQLFPRFPYNLPTGPAPQMRSHAKKAVAEGAEPPKPGRPVLRRRPVPPKAAE
jgi:integrase